MADNKYKLQFTLSNGETINAGEIVAPQGPKGDKGDKGDSADIPYSSSTPFMDGVGSAGSAKAVARSDHRHPSDTTRQEKLVSGENIKTIGGQSILGSGDIPIDSGGVTLPITYSGTGESGAVSIIDATYSSGYPGAAMISLKYGSYEMSISPVMFTARSGRQQIKIQSSSITYTPGTDESDAEFLREDNVKTLFGNQSIYGSGNIDLYRHNVKLTSSSLECVFTVISSSNTAIDSLTDLFSILKPIVGSDSIYPINGRVLYNNKYYTATKVYPTADGAIIANTADEERWFGWSTLGTLTFYDNVTTV